MTTKLLSLLNKNDRLVIGLISGTSKDGIDAALVKLKGSGVDTKVDLVKFTCLPYSTKVRERLDNLIPSCTVQEISDLNFLIGEEFANAALAVASEAGLSTDDVDLIGSHGQTVFHNPPSRKDGIPSTLQIGETSVIAERTGVTTVGDFRTRDIASGGEGAPLVPYFDFLLLSEKSRVKIAQNIGGIGNATVVTENIEDVIAFDTGPGNMLMDKVISLATQGRESFDKDGRTASEGAVRNDLLTELMTESYFSLPPPKTTGEELFGSEKCHNLFNKANEGAITLPDLMQTLMLFTVETIARSYEKFIFPNWDVSEIVFSGGGCKNPVLMQKLRDRLKGYECMSTDDYGIPSEAKEAVAFAVLANELVSGNKTNMPRVTGAGSWVPMGKIVLGT